jgi:hypothetical protein
MKSCPYCDKEIQDDAVSCCHCGRDLGETPASDSGPPIAGPAQAPSQLTRNVSPGVALAVVGGVIAVIILLVIGGIFEPKARSGPGGPRDIGPTPKPRAWYSGGTLHRAKMSVWSSSSYADRLATSADFVTRMMQIDGRTIPPVEQIRPAAERLERCITAANSSGAADGQDVATVAATCWVLLQQ